MLINISSVLKREGENKMSNYPYQDKQLPVEKRVKDLMDRMTLDQKTQQLTCAMVMGTHRRRQSVMGWRSLHVYRTSPG